MKSEILRERSKSKRVNLEAFSYVPFTAASAKTRSGKTERQRK